MTIPFNLSKFADYLNASGNANPLVASDQTNTSTGSLGLPYGTTAQRPSSPAAGYTRINTTTNVVEVYYNSTWNTIFTFPPVVPTTIGQSFGGGYYAGKISTTGNGVATHYLIVAPKATGEIFGKQYGPYNVTTGATSNYDGSSNTAILAALGSTYEAATFCKGLSIGGYTDWYLPSFKELAIIYYYLKPSTTTNINTGANIYAVSPQPYDTNYSNTNPAQTTASVFQDGNSEAFVSNIYWTSTEISATSAEYINFSNGTQNPTGKNSAGYYYTRAIRKIAI